MADFQPPPTWASPVLVDQTTKVAQFNPVWLKWFVDLTALINASGGGGGVINHNALAGLQGGAIGEYYHLRSSEHAELTGVKAANKVLAGPAAGGPAAATFRDLVTADLANQIVTYAKIQNVTDERLIGRSAGVTGAPMEITVGSGMSLVAGVLSATGASGTVTGPGSSTDRAIPTWNGVGGTVLRDNPTVIISSGGALTETINQNAATQIVISNNNASGGAEVQFRATNGTDVGVFGITGTGYSTYGALVSGSPYMYGSNNRGLTFMADNVNGVIKWATGGNTLRMTLNESGQLVLAQTGASGGINVGGDCDLFRDSANIWRTPDTVLVTGTAHPGIVSGVYLADTAGGFVGMIDSTRAVNDRRAGMQWNGGSLHLQVIDDGLTASTDFFTLTGGQGVGIPLIASPAAISNVFGHSASVTIGNQGKLQVTGTTDAASQFQVGRFSNNTGGGNVALGKSRSGTAGTNTIVTNGDNLGNITAYGANGSTYTPAAQLSFNSDGTPGVSNDMPGNIIALTTPDGSGTLTEAWRVDSAQKHVFQVDRAVRFNNQTSAAGASAGTLLNAPTAGDPGYWLKVNIDGTNYALPAWAG